MRKTTQNTQQIYREGLWTHTGFRAAQMKNKDKDEHEGKQRGRLNPGMYITTVSLKHTGMSKVT